jgi:hypothetical protein
MMNRIFTVAVLIPLATIATVTASGRGGWTTAQIEELQSLSRAANQPRPRDKNKTVADE